MATGLGTLWKLEMSAPQTTTNNSYATSTFTKALNKFIKGFFADYMKPVFMVNGTLTSPTGASAPLIGKFGNICVANTMPAWSFTIRRNFGKDPFWVGFLKCVEDVINQGTYTVNMNSYGIMTPMPVKINVDLQSFGENIDPVIKAQKPANPKALTGLTPQQRGAIGYPPDLFATIDRTVNNAIKATMPITTTYAGAGGPGAFTGTMTIKL